MIFRIIGTITFIFRLGLDIISYGRIGSIPDPRKKSLKYVAGLMFFPFSWRIAAGVKRNRFALSHVFTASSAWSVLTSRGDDILDKSQTLLESPDVIRNDPLYKKAMNSVIESIKKSPASQQMQNDFLKDISLFEDNQFAWYLDFNKNGDKHDFLNVCRHKYRTCGLNGRMYARIFHLFAPEISESYAAKVENLTEALFMYYQVKDDLIDYQIDRGKVENYLDAALVKFPEERMLLDSAFAKGKNRIKYLRNIAPQAFAICDEVADQFISGFNGHLKKLIEELKIVEKLSYRNMLRLPDDRLNLEVKLHKF